MNNLEKNSNAETRQLKKMYSFLVTTRKHIDGLVDEINSIKKSGHSTRKSQGSKRKPRKSTSKRMKNEFILPEAILQVLTPKRAKSTNQIIEGIQKRDLYRTKSDNLYYAVNSNLNKMSKNGLVEKEKAGMFKSSLNPQDIPLRKKRGRPSKKKEETVESQ